MIFTIPAENRRTEKYIATPGNSIVTITPSGAINAFQSNPQFIHHLTKPDNESTTSQPERYKTKT